jgi:CRISPR-associated endonuclease Csn1
MNDVYLQWQDKLRKKLNGRDYRVGLDLGVGSIGFCVVSMENDENNGLLPTEIIMSGSRIFQASKGAADRRLQKGQRNNHRHNRERKRYLWKLLAEKSLALPFVKDLEKKENSSDAETSSKRFAKEVLQKDPYTLRVQALDKKLELQEIGYCLYHIANHRGSCAIRTFEEDCEEQVKENTENKKIAGNINKIMKEKNYQTYGQYLYKEKFESNEMYKRQKVTNTDSVKSFSPSRDLLIKEAKIILNKQSQFYGDVLTKDYIEKLLNSIFYETEKLIPESGTCPYFKDEKRLARSHKLNEYRRLWEALNNARFDQAVFDNETGEITSYEQKQFDVSQKQILFDYLLTVEKLTTSKTKELLKLDGVDHFDICLQGRDKKTQEIKGYKLRKLENMSFWKRLDEDKQDKFLYDWNSCPDEKTLSNKLLKEYGLTNEEIDIAFSEIVLSSSYAPVGKSAMKILLKYIKEGLSYIEAEEKARASGQFKKDKSDIQNKLPYYGAILPESTQKVIAKAFSKQFENRKYKKPHTNADEYEYGRIANPVVHQTLNELRKLVNEIIDIFDKKPIEFGLETARELKKSIADRDELVREQTANENRRTKIYEEYIRPHLATIESKRENPSNYILKFDLWQEQGEHCPFCQKQISADDIINGYADIEHLFPVSESEDNSRNNLVLACSNCNANKAQHCPFEAFGHSPKIGGMQYSYNDMLSNIGNKDKNRNFTNKAWRFYQGAFEKFMENKPMPKRFATDNSYVSKITHKYLACLFEKPKIFCVKGSLTAQLRLAWGLNGLLIPFARNLVKENELEKFNKEVNKNKKIRMDNRHHSLDAIVIAYASKGYGDMLNRVSAKGYRMNYSQKNWLSKILIPPKNKDAQLFECEIKDALKQAFISIKHDHSDNGELTKGTMYKIYPSQKGYTLTTYKNLKDLKFEEAKDPDKTIEKALLKFDGREKELKNVEIKKFFDLNKRQYENIKNNLEKARQELELENEKSKSEGKKERKITDILVYKKAIDLLSNGKFVQLSKKEPDKFFAIKKPTEDKAGYGYDTGDNLCIDLFYDKQGKLKGEVIRKLDVKQEKISNYKKQGFTLFERVYVGDILEMDFSDEKKSLSNRTGSVPDDRVFVRVVTFTEIPNGIQIHFANILKSKNEQDDSVNINSMQKYNPRKVILSSAGIIKYRSKILIDKEG